jgi:sugar phosphate isomerase/epimerase
MRIAISLNICVNRCAEEDMIPLLAKAGFDGLDFNFCDLSGRVDWNDGLAVARLLDPWQRAAQAAGMAWVQAHGPMFNLFGQSPEDQFLRSLCVPAIRASGRLGVPWMVLHPNIVAGPFDKAHRRAVLDGNVAFFRSLLPECEKAQVGIAIENLFDSAGRHANRNCPRFYGAVPEELCELVDALDHPLIGACWDTGHARLMGLEPAQCLPILGRRLKALHVQENDGRDDDHMLPFSNGPKGVDWAGVCAGLRAAGYQGALTYEVHNAFLAVPTPLLESSLRHAAEIGRYLVRQVETESVVSDARRAG